MGKTTPTILIIEDDVNTRDVLSRLLTAAGYNVRLAANGWEGLLALENPPHAIVLDMMLPGMDGFVFLNSLRGQRSYQHLPVIVFTAMDVREVLPKVRPLGVGQVIAKNDTGFPRVKEALRAVLGTPRAHSRVTLPEPGSMIRPYLDAYMKMLAWY